MPRVSIKKWKTKLILQSACHISENADSNDLGGILKQFSFTRTESNFFIEGKSGNELYFTGGVKHC